MSRVAIMSNSKTSIKHPRPELIDSIKSRMDRVYVGLVNDGKINDYYKLNNIRVIKIDANRNNINPIKELKSIINISKKLKENKINSVIIYGVKNHISMTIGAKLAGVNKIMCVVNGRGNLFVQKGLKWEIVRFMSLPMLKLAYSLADNICFQNNDDRKLFIDNKLVKDGIKLFTTNGSGVNLQEFPLTQIVSDISFLFLSRITKSKGVEDYIEAARIVKGKYPEAIFNIVGPIDNTVEKSDLNSILQDAVKEGIVKYHGETDNVSRCIGNCRYFVFPSYYPEGVPRSILQALATGRPVITCNTPGCKETVINKVNGFIVEKNNREQLAEKMIRLIEHTNETDIMAVESRKLSEKKFDVNKINSQILKKLLFYEDTND